MKLEKWAHASEIFGSIAIVVSLIVLISEVRGNTAVQQRQMELDRTLNYTDMFLQSPELADVMAKVKAVDGAEPLAAAYMERYGLTQAEAVLWSRAVSRGLFIWHAQYVFNGPSQDLEDEIRSIHEYPDLRIAFETNEDEMLSPEFVEYVLSITGGQ